MRDDRARGRMGKGGGAGVLWAWTENLIAKEIDLLDLDKWLIEIVSFFFFFFNFKNLGTFYFEFIDLSIFSSTEYLFFPPNFLLF